jgi:hypothetical protein
MLGEVVAFYGLGWAETVAMDFRWFCKLYTRIPVIEARRQLAWLSVQAYPHVDKEAREGIHAELMRRSGYERQRQDALATDRFEVGWAMLRSFGRAAQTGATVEGEAPVHGEHS